MENLVDPDPSPFQMTLVDGWDIHFPREMMVIIHPEAAGMIDMGRPTIEAQYPIEHLT